MTDQELEAAARAHRKMMAMICKENQDRTAAARAEELNKRPYSQLGAPPPGKEPEEPERPARAEHLPFAGRTRRIHLVDEQKERVPFLGARRPSRGY